MFIGQPLPNGHPGISRPFVVAVILLLLFWSMQTDWSPPRGAKPRTDVRQLQAVPADNATREATKEKVGVGSDTRVCYMIWLTPVPHCSLCIAERLPAPSCMMPWPLTDTCACRSFLS